MRRVDDLIKAAFDFAFQWVENGRISFEQWEAALGFLLEMVH